MDTMAFPKIDKTAFAVASLPEPSDESVICLG